MLQNSLYNVVPLVLKCAHINSVFPGLVPPPYILNGGYMASKRSKMDSSRLKKLTLPVYKAQTYRVHKQIINVSIVLKYFIGKLCLGKNCLKDSSERQYLEGGRVERLRTPSLDQNFSISVLLTYWARQFFAGG